MNAVDKYRVQIELARKDPSIPLPDLGVTEFCDFTRPCPDHFYCVLADGHSGDHGGYEDDCEVCA